MKNQQMYLHRTSNSSCTHRPPGTIVSLCTIVGLFLSGQSGQVAGQTDRPPNIVVILADDMGYGDVQALNPSSKIPTPNLNTLAAEGMTFTDGHSPSAVCTPTRYGLLTGRYCWRTELKRGVLGGYSKPLLKPGRATIASMLRASGYTTGAVGKWHLGMDLPLLKNNADTSRWDGDPGIDFSGIIIDSPIHHGFDSYFGVTGSLDMAPYVYVRNDRFTMEPSIQQQAVSFPHFVRKGPRATDFVIADVLDDIAGEAADYIGEASKKDAPYFLYMPMTGPHKPAQPHERFRGKTGLKEYGDFVAQVDWTVGHVLDAIDASDEADRTLVFYTSDNGSYMYRYDDDQQKDHVQDATVQGFRSENHRANGIRRGTKADIWEAGHRVPFFVRWPGHIKAGTQNSGTVCLTDIYATCAAVVGADLSDSEAEDSISLLPMLQGKTVARGAPVINHSAGGMFAIRDGRWKLVAGNGSGGRQAPKGRPFQKPYQLFDLQADPGEAHNIADQHPDIVARLTESLAVIRNGDRTPNPGK
jgi:arylsulfatase A-like enzyme